MNKSICLPEHVVAYLASLHVRVPVWTQECVIRLEVCPNRFVRAMHPYAASSGVTPAYMKNVLRSAMGTIPTRHH